VVNSHQRPKLERYGDILFVVLHAARYVDETETEVFGGDPKVSRRIS
jgi:magnesium transporter